MATDARGRSLTDLRISLTDRCNLRCTYCMPKEVFGPDYEFLRRQQWLRFKELDDVVDVFVRLGVRKIRLTGGEPLLRPGLTKYIAGRRGDLTGRRGPLPSLDSSLAGLRPCGRRPGR